MNYFARLPVASVCIACTAQEYRRDLYVRQGICVQAKLALEAAVTYYAAGEGVVPIYGFGNVLLPKAVADRISSRRDLSDLESSDGDVAEMCRVPALFAKRLHKSLEHQLEEEDEDDEGRHRRLIVDLPVVLKAYGQAFTCLHRVHALGIVHNDVDDRNLLTDLPLGQPNCKAYLADFGQALHASGRHARLVQPGALFDAESLLRLEQGIRGARESDVFALALATWSTLSGVRFTMLDDPDQQMLLIAQRLATHRLCGMRHRSGSARMAYRLPHIQLLLSSESLMFLRCTLEAAAAMFRHQRTSAEECAAALLNAAYDPNNAGVSLPGAEWVTEEEDVKAQHAAGMYVRLDYQSSWTANVDEPAMSSHGHKLVSGSVERVLAPLRAPVPCS
jgi:hypothetical protein